MRLKVIRVLAVAAMVIACFPSGSAQQIRRTLAVSLAEPLTLRVEIEQGDLQIAYARDGEVTVSVIAPGNSGVPAERESLAQQIRVEKTNNQIEIRDGDNHSATRLIYRIDVPYRTEVTASLEYGKATISGIMGPVKAEVNVGDIDISRVSLGVTGQARLGNLRFEVVGGKVEARTLQGNVVCQRAPQGINAETQYGDITLAEFGASLAVVKTGGGRIDAAGVRIGL